MTAWLDLTGEDGQPVRIAVAHVTHYRRSTVKGTHIWVLGRSNPIGVTETSAEVDALLGHNASARAVLDELGPPGDVAASNLWPLRSSSSGPGIKPGEPRPPRQVASVCVASPTGQHGPLRVLDAARAEPPAAAGDTICESCNLVVALG